MTFANRQRPSPALASAAARLRVWVAKNRPDVDGEAWIHSWQQDSAKEEQIEVALLLEL